MMKMRFFFLFFTFALLASGCTAGSETAVIPPNTAALPPAEDTEKPEPTEAVRVPTEEINEPIPSPIVEESANRSSLPVIEPAPAWNNDVWINSKVPLPLEDLNGKVVLLEFWTFG